MKSIKKQLIELVQELQSQQESSELEFKRAEEKLPEDFWETYSSFANTEGGYIFLGVNEKPWEICGVKNPEGMLSDLCNSANNKEKVSYNLIENKYLQIHDIDGKKIISVYIPEVKETSKPVYLKGNPLNAYIRKHEGDYKSNMGISDRAGTGGATLLNFAVANRFRAPEIKTNLSSTTLKLWIAAPLESHPEFDEKEKMIYEFIFKSKGGVSVPELEAATGLTMYQVRKVLASLTESGLLTKMGRARATRYVCTPSIVERKDIADRLRRSLLEIK